MAYLHRTALYDQADGKNSMDREAFAKLQTAISNDEPTMFYSRHSTVQSTRKPKGVIQQEVERAIQEFQSEFVGAEKLDFVYRPSKERAFGARVTAGLAAQRIHTIKGGYTSADRPGDRGTVVLIGSDLDNYRDIQETIRHEVLAHYGLNLFSPEDRQKVIDRILTSRASPGLADVWSEIDRDYTDLPESKKAEELLARIAEHKPSRVGALWNELVALFDKLLKKLHIIGNYVTRSELVKLVETIAQAVKENKQQQTYSRKPPEAVVPLRKASNFTQARLAARAFQNQDLRNTATGFVARVSRNSLDKMLNEKSVGKSETPSSHALAVANLDKLFEKAVLGWSKPDAGGDPNITAIHRFFVPVEVADKV